LGRLWTGKGIVFSLGIELDWNSKLRWKENSFHFNSVVCVYYMVFVLGIKGWHPISIHVRMCKPKCVFDTWTPVPLVLKIIILNFKEKWNKYLHRYKYSEGTAEILKKICCILSYKKEFLFDKYNAISTETSHEYSGHVYIFMK
jgi:hypothetical protein